MPYAPSVDATLLRRRVVGLLGGGLVAVREYYYEPSTRTSDFIEYESEDETDFSLPSSVLIDRFCVAAGVAPYTEQQVTHAGGNAGSLVFTAVDGATACQVSCTIGVTLTATPVHDGRATLTAEATGAVGAVLFSWDGFDTPGLAPNGPAGTTLRTREDQRPGAYAVSVRETRAGGCTAAATLAFTAPYAPRYELPFRNAADEPCLLRISQREYAGAVEVLPYGQQTAVTLDWPGGATDHVYTTLLRGAECALRLRVTTEDQYRQLFSGDERLHRVDYYRAGEHAFAGYLLPEQYDTPFLSHEVRPEFNLSATDGLGTLSSIPFQGPGGERLRGDWTLLRLLLYCLGKLELGLDLHVLFNFYPATATVSNPAIVQIKKDVGEYVTDKGVAWDCGRVVKELLTSFGCRLYQQAGVWRLERLIELTAEDLSYQVWAADGTPGIDVSHTLLQVIDAPGGALPQWREGSQRQGLRAAVRTVTATSEPGELSNLLAFALPKNADLPGEIPAAWSSATSTPGVPVSRLLFQGKDKAPILRLYGSTANKTTPLLAPWVQTQLTPPVALGRGTGGSHNEETFVIRLTLKPYGVTPATLLADVTDFFVALHFGRNWLNGNVGAATEQADPVILQGTFFENDQEQEFVVRGFASAQVGPQPLFLRFYTPVGGASAVTLDITDIRLEYDDNHPEIADFVTTYTSDTGSLVSRTDELTLFHLDTPHARYPGTLLDSAGLPTQGWYEPEARGQVRELGDYLMRDRVLWQRSPAQVLSGPLTGLRGPGALLTDPSESHPGVYLLTAATCDEASGEWAVNGVQLLPLVAPPVELPPFAIYSENDRAWLAEDGRVLTYEHA